MEPPHHMFLGGASEECHSSESGWTMYIGSPIDDDDDHEEEEDKYPYCYEGPDEVVESDDSMASDASSGPSHYYGVVRHDLQQKVLEEDQYGGGEDHECKGSTQIEEKKIKEKKKHEMGFMNNSSSKGKAPSSVQGGGKGRKNHWVGKRK